MINSCFLFSCFVLVSFVSDSILGHTLQSNDVLTSNRTIVSENKEFEIGFFKLGGDDERWYLGMWYKPSVWQKPGMGNNTIHMRDYVWIANRDKPLSNSAGTLQISGANLVLRDQFGIIVWSTNVTSVLSPPSPMVAKLLPNGNFVLKSSQKDKNMGEVFRWQSFDYPTDTLLPEMKLGWDKRSRLNRALTSWKSEDDPSSGDYSLRIDINGFPQLYLWERNLVILRINSFNPQNKIEVMFNLTMTDKEITYSFGLVEHQLFSRIILRHSGALQSFSWFPEIFEWVLPGNEPTDVCDMYAICPADSICEMNISVGKLPCKCYKGFENKTWPVGKDETQCQRKTPLNCKGDEFFLLKKMKLPDTRTAIVHRFIGLNECRKKCQQNCTCLAFASMDTSNIGLVCLLWTGLLVDLRIFTTEGEDLYVRLAAADIVPEKGKDTREKRNEIIIGVSVIITVLFMSFPIIWLWSTTKKKKRARAMHQGVMNTYLVPLHQGNGAIRTDFQQIVKATNDFADSFKLGEGGFGVVYKGTLLDGKEVAVKRLAELTANGKAQFGNEVDLIGKLQHVNLVQLLGYCQDSQEHILILEYMENLSLSSYLFGDTTQRCKLNCQRRLEIAKGIARGLQYLHTDSRFRIIHRDMKASHILLDKEMIPKISDFGMARLIGNDMTGDETKRLVGTYGYMAPEYMMDGIFSIKSDVFSFGILLIEILTGKRNWRFENSNGDKSLLTCVWRNMEQGSLMEIVDSCIGDWASHAEEVLRCFHIGLLCVQERAEDRPTMPTVVVMLDSEAAIPQPKPPGYGYGNPLVERRRYVDSGASSSWSGQTSDNTWTGAADVTMSVVEPR